MATQTQKFVKAKTLKEVFNFAADYLEQHGWVRHAYGSKKGAKKIHMNIFGGMVAYDFTNQPACAMGAIQAVIDEGDPTKIVFKLKQEQRLRRQAIRALTKAIDPTIKMAYETDSYITDWNDKRTRKAEEVIAKLRELGA